MENKLSISLLSPLKEVMNVHEIRAVSRQCKMSKLHVHAHTKTHRSAKRQLFFTPYLTEIMQESVSVFDSLPFTMMDFSIVFSSSW